MVGFCGLLELPAEGRELLLDFGEFLAKVSDFFFQTCQTIDHRGCAGIRGRGRPRSHTFCSSASETVGSPENKWV